MLGFVVELCVIILYRYHHHEYHHIPHLDRRKEGAGKQYGVFTLILNVCCHDKGSSKRPLSVGKRGLPCMSGPGFTKGLKFRQFFCLDKS